MRLHILCYRGHQEEHFFDVGTREQYGYPRRVNDPPRFLEDYLDDYEQVTILEYGEGYFKCVPSYQKKRKALLNCSV